MIVLCEVCKKEFYKRPGQIKKTKHNFCSKKCMGKFNLGKYTKRTLVSCEYCGKEFLKRDCEIKDCNHNFCSHVCADTYNSGENNWWYGKHFSKELSDKVSSSRKGKNTGKENPQWKGGIKMHGDGYKYLLKPEHPYSTKDGYIMEHRLVMEKEINRFLEPNEIVHHINGDRADNRKENLMLFASIKEHLSYHKNLDKANIV